MITVSRNAIVKALNTLLPVAGWHGNVTLSAANDRLHIRAVHKDGLHVLLTLPVGTGGDVLTVTVHARGLLDCLRSVAGDVTLSLNAAKVPGLVVGAADASFTLLGQDAPNLMPPMPDGPTLTVNGADLATLIDRVGYAMAPEGSWNKLEGMNLERAERVDDTLTAVATDGNRLAWSSVPADGELAFPKGAILSARAVKMLRRLPLGERVMFAFTHTMGERQKAGAPKGTMEPYMASAHVRVSGDGFLLHDRLTLVDFPDWRQVLPTTTSRTLTLDRDDFATAIKRGGRMARDRDQTVTTTINPGRLSFASRDLEVGSASASVPAGVEWELRPLTIGLNRTFVLDALKAMPKGPVRVDVAGGTNPALSPLTFTSLVDGRVKGVLMPLRI